MTFFFSNDTSSRWFHGHTQRWKLLFLTKKFSNKRLFCVEIQKLQAIAQFSLCLFTEVYLVHDSYAKSFHSETHILGKFQVILLKIFLLCESQDIPLREFEEHSFEQKSQYSIQKNRSFHSVILLNRNRSILHTYIAKPRLEWQLQIGSNLLKNIQKLWTKFQKNSIYDYFIYLEFCGRSSHGTF